MASTFAAQIGPGERPTEHPYVVHSGAGEGTTAMIRGSRIAVRLVVQMYREGDSVEDILHAYPHLSAAAVHDAISYYLDHRAEIEKEIMANRVEYVISEQGAQINERGFISFDSKPENG
ncbi:MAG: DUF433 domain-containing protein [Chloroflexota bacterium]